MSEPMIVSDPKVMMGKPVVAGTRITVNLILEKLGSGESIEVVLEALLAALRFAAKAHCGLRSSTRSTRSRRDPGRR